MASSGGVEPLFWWFRGGIPEEKWPFWGSKMTFLGSKMRFLDVFFGVFEGKNDDF